MVRLFIGSLTRFTVLLALATTVAIPVATADDFLPKQEHQQPIAPVTLRVQKVKSGSATERALQVELAIGSEFQIYSEHQNRIWLPLKVELLDGENQPIKSKLTFPKPKKIEVDENLGGNIFVYEGSPQIVAKCAVDAEPKFLRVFYHGYSKNGY